MKVKPIKENCKEGIAGLFMFADERACRKYLGKAV